MIFSPTVHWEVVMMKLVQLMILISFCTGDIMEIKDILMRKNMVKCWKILEFEIYYLVLQIEAHVYLVIIFAKKILIFDIYEKIQIKRAIISPRASCVKYISYITLQYIFYISLYNIYLSSPPAR